MVTDALIPSYLGLFWFEISLVFEGLTHPQQPQPQSFLQEHRLNIHIHLYPSTYLLIYIYLFIYMKDSATADSRHPERAAGVLVRRSWGPSARASSDTAGC